MLPYLRVWLLRIGIAVLAWPAGPAHAQSPAGPPATPVEVAAVRVEDLKIEISAVGTLLANESVTLRPEIAGRITAIRFKEGDKVRKGDLLFTLDAATHQAQLAESSSAFKLQELNYERSKSVLARKVISQQEFDQQSALLEQARARVALVEAELKKTEIRAPFDGVLGLRRVSPGDYVQDGDELVDLVDSSTIKLDFQVPETYLPDLRPGQQVDVRVDAFPGASYRGQVYVIAQRLDAASRSVPLRARVANPKGELRPGMFARVKLRVAERDKAVLVPEESIWPMGRDRFVYRVVDGKAVLTKIELGFRRSGEVEVRSGLAAGDVVVTAGQPKLRDGAAVKPVAAGNLRVQR